MGGSGNGVGGGGVGDLGGVVGGWGMNRMIHPDSPFAQGGARPSSLGLLCGLKGWKHPKAANLGREQLPAICEAVEEGEQGGEGIEK